MKTGQKHLIRCVCVLTQYKDKADPPNHQFIVFSELDEHDEILCKYAQCNNCGVIHKVTGLCQSEIMFGRDSFALLTIDDVKTSLSEKIVHVLETHNADLSTWEAVKFIVVNKRWGETVVLSSSTDGEIRQGKYVQVLGENMLRIEQFVREEVIR